MFAIQSRKDADLFFHLPESSHERRTRLPEFRRGAVPRLFRLKSHAQSALANWVVADFGYRRMEDWQIVEVELLIKDGSNDQTETETAA